MTPVKILAVTVALFLLLWLAYKIGVVILRVIVGLAFLSLIAFAIWRFALH